jgi:hypothetical protein
MMSLELALRLTEIVLGFAFLLQSVEHVRDGRWLFGARIVLSVLLVVGFYTPMVSVALFVLALFMLKRFQGPYNGGSDRMGLLILCCVCLLHFMPSLRWQEYVFGYLAVQLVLSYFISGWVKIMNPEWRSGRALGDVFAFSAYPVSEGLRGLAERPRLLLAGSWAVMVFEVLFPLALVSQVSLIVALVVAAGFHLANACVFGLNRFFGIWLAAYPSLIWLQGRIFEGGFAGY